MEERRDVRQADAEQEEAGKEGFRTGDLQDMWYARLKGKKIQDKSRDTGKEGCSKGGVQERRNAGNERRRK